MPIVNTYIQTNARVGPSFSLSRINLHRIIFIRSGLCYFSKPSSLQHLPNLAINFCLCLIAIFIAWTCSASDTVFPGFQTLFHEIILYHALRGKISYIHILTLRLMQYAVSRYEKKVLYQCCCMSHICTLPSTPPGSPLALGVKKRYVLRDWKSMSQYVITTVCNVKIMIKNRSTSICVVDSIVDLFVGYTFSCRIFLLFWLLSSQQ